MELLREAPREAYSFQNAGWPNDVVDLKTEELPAVVWSGTTRGNRCAFAACCRKSLSAASGTTLCSFGV